MTSSALRLGAILWIAVASACGVPIDESATEIAAEELPESLRTQPTPNTAPNGPVGPNGPLLASIADIWLVRPPGLDGGRTVLVEVSRAVADDELSTALVELFEPPEDGETAEGLVSPMAGLDPPTGVDIDGSTVTIALAGLPPLEGELLKQTFAQMVFTALEFESITRVQFSTDSTGPFDVPIDGGLTQRTVSRADFGSLDPLVEVDPPVPAEQDPA